MRIAFRLSPVVLLASFICLPHGTLAGDFFGEFAYPTEATICRETDGVEFCLVDGALPTSVARELSLRVRVENKSEKTAQIDLESVTLTADLPGSRIVRRNQKEVQFLCRRRIVYSAPEERRVNRELFPDEITLGPAEKREGVMRFAILEKGEIRQKEPLLRGIHNPSIFEVDPPMWVEVAFRKTKIARLPLALLDYGGALFHFAVWHGYNWRLKKREPMRRVDRIWGDRSTRLFEYSDGGVILLDKARRLFCDGRRNDDRLRLDGNISHPVSGRKRCNLKKHHLPAQLSTSIANEGGQAVLTLGEQEWRLKLRGGAPP